MKKQLFTLALGALSFSAFSQAPTITSAMLPTIGTTINQVNDSTTADRATFTVSAGSSSAQTWNYTTEWVHTYTSSTSFISPTGGTDASSFPTANMAEVDASGDWIYFTSNASGLALNGAYIASYSLALPYTPSEVIIPTPFTYANTLVNAFTTTYSLTSSGYIVKQHNHSTRTFTGDAFGSITTPTGTYSNTLRIKTYQHDIDTQWVYSGAILIQTTPKRDSSITYGWYQNSHPISVMTINMNGTGTAVTSANYTSSYTTGMETHYIPFANLSVYPNPAIANTNLSYENKNATHITIQLFDISGKLITTLANENQTAGIQTLPIDTKALQLNAGLYFVRISSPNGSETMKLSIN